MLNLSLPRLPKIMPPNNAPGGEASNVSVLMMKPEEKNS